MYPIEDALHITNEIKSLRLISVELMDLLQDGTVTDSKLPRQLIIPLISCSISLSRSIYTFFYFLKTYLES